MEQEKIVQIAMSESSDIDGGGTLHVLALSNTGRIFKGGDISNSQYKYEFGWKELPCPIKYVADAKELAESQPI